MIAPDRTTGTATESTSASQKTTWVVLCRDRATGRPDYPEYVQGTELIRDTTTGVLRVLDCGRLVREYTEGAWTSFCEWVTDYTDYLTGSLIRLSSDDDTPLENPPDASRALAAAMAMDTRAAMALMAGSLPWPRRSSESDGAVRAPARLPGPRHA